MVHKARENFFTLLYPEPKNMCENQHFAINTVGRFLIASIY